MLRFWKMNGAGNDFVVVDNRSLSLELTRERIAHLCHRQRGIGADGLLAVEPPQGDGQYRMRYYNADGGEAEMCGNGARCFARFTDLLAGGNLESVQFETEAGMIGAQLVGTQVRLSLSEPHALQTGLTLAVGDEALAVDFINTGVPHAVVFVDDLENTDVVRLGAALRYHPHFSPKGTNANFVKVIAPGHIAIRTYERGVEDETLACGTGMAACALIHHLHTGCDSPVKVDVKGGDTLEVGFEPVGHHQYHSVTLTGPAEITFSGETSL